MKTLTITLDVTEVTDLVALREILRPHPELPEPVTGHDTKGHPVQGYQSRHDGQRQLLVIEKILGAVV